LQEIIENPALSRDDAIRIGALIRLASLNAASGDLQAARAAFEMSGVSAQQCALVDSAPKLLHSNVGTDAFPSEALRWGFEGWTQVQFDIGANGKVLSPRAIISYPPFVFTNAGKAIASGFQYAKTFRPGAELGCGGTDQRIKFLLP
jgi:hypothetical protein